MTDGRPTACARPARYAVGSGPGERVQTWESQVGDTFVTAFRTEIALFSDVSPRIPDGLVVQVTHSGT